MKKLISNIENTFKIESRELKLDELKTNDSQNNELKLNKPKLIGSKSQESKSQESKSYQPKFIELNHNKLGHNDLRLTQIKFTEEKNSESKIIEPNFIEPKIIGTTITETKIIASKRTGSEMMSSNLTSLEHFSQKNINPHDIKKLTDLALLDQFKNLILREKRLGDLILLNLQEINGRRLYAQLGYASLFEFLVKYFHLSESSAYQRINAMKLIQAVPEARMALVAGETNLSTMAATQGFIRKMESEKHLTSAEKKDIFNSIKGKTQKEAQATFAKINPIAALPATKEKPLTAEHTLLQVTVDQETLQLFHELKNHLSHEIPDGDFNKILKRISKIGLEILKKKKGRSSADNSAQGSAKSFEDSSPDCFSGNFADSSADCTSDVTSNGATENSAGSFVGNFSGGSTNSSENGFADRSGKKSVNDSANCFTDISTGSFQNSVATKTAQELLNADIQNPSAEHHPKHRSSKRCETILPSRYISATTRRRVFRRAQNRCEFVGSNGKRCESHYQLEVDHKFPWSQGGSNEESNLRCFCKVHNNFRTKETHGFWWRDMTS